MRILAGTMQDKLSIGSKHKLTGEALCQFASTKEHLIEYDVNPETGVSVPVKIDGLSIMHEPVKGVVPDYLRERMQAPRMGGGEG